MQTETGQLTEPQWLELLLWTTVAAAAIWLLLTLFVMARRRAANLTPVNAPDAKKSAQPDFMQVDHKAREAQIKRGESFERDLDTREAAEAAEKEKATRQVTVLQRLAGLATFLFSVFSLLSMASTVIWQVGNVGGMLSNADKLALIVQKYPIPVAVCVFVIGFQAYAFFANKRWKSFAK